MQWEILPAPNDPFEDLRISDCPMEVVSDEQHGGHETFKKRLLEACSMNHTCLVLSIPTVFCRLNASEGQIIMATEDFGAPQHHRFRFGL
ncbi:hypothetical protein TSMEX_001511 [Taenia solium]|eukprot:TsM_001125500 transcript=TsM_001125500 gene=TsM_001125500